MYATIVQLLLGVILFQCMVNCAGIRSSPKCPARSESDARCRKECRTNADCRNRKNNKRCICDGPCGLSCVRIKQKCYEDRSLVTQLRKGTVLLNGRRYSKKVFRVGDTVSYSCRRGFKLSGPSQVTCSGIGKWKPWDKGTPVCSKRCKDPGNPKNGNRWHVSFDVGETVTFTCHPGYSLNGRREARCLSSLEWSHPPPICEVFKCQDPVLPNNSNIYKGRSSSYPHGSRILLRCKPGHFLRGSSLMYCNTGEWKAPRGRTMRCLPKSCGIPSPISNGFIKGTLYTFGKFVTYGCNIGYRLRGYSRRRCLASENWSGSPPLCEKVNCGEPEAVANGNVVRSGTKYLDQASVTCDVGYTTKGSEKISCTRYGKWSEKLECIGVTCDERYNSIDNGVAIGTYIESSCRNSYNCKLTFSCNYGYELNSGRRTKVVVCKADGTWSGLKPVCQRISCGLPRNPQHGRRKGWDSDFLFESIIEYECDRGYDIIGTRTRQCLGNRAWSGNVPRCEANCGNPGVLQNGHIYGSSFKSGDRLTFSCNVGYEIFGTRSSTCDQSTARWKPVIPRCNRISCGSPPALLHGRMKRWGGNFLFESIIEYECDRGYDIIGTPRRQCLGNKTWSGNVPRCEANCGNPGVLQNGHIYGSSFKSGDRLTFNCSYGYEITGTRSSTCDQSTARWKPVIPRCDRISCGSPPVLLHGRMKSLDGSFLFESIVEYECHRRYDIIGRRTRQCLGNRAWSGSAPRCEANCGNPGVLQNGNIYGSSFKSGDRLTFSCSYGYEITGTRSSTCDPSTARWKPAIPRCNRISCDAPSIPPYGKLKETSNHYYYKSIITYECNKGYDMIGNSTRECLLNKQWKGSAPVCQANCGDPGIPQHGSRDSNEFTAGKTIIFKCNTGYKLVGAGEIKCEADTAKWTRGIPTCRKKCDDPLGMEDGSITDEQISVSNSIKRYNWKPRFQSKNTWCGLYKNGEIIVRIQFKSVVTITSVYFEKHDEIKGWFHYYDARKRENIFSKKYYQNGPWQKLTNIIPPIQTSFFEIVMTGQSGTTVCEKFEIYGCTASTTCPIPKAPKNGEVLGLLYKDGDKAAYSCKHGYKLERKIAQTCRPDGSWIGAIPECIKDDSQGVCYKDSKSGRTLAGITYNVSPDGCVSRCRGMRYRYAGLQYGDQCFCGNFLNRELFAHQSECYVPCKHDPTRKCGGPWRNSIYKIW